MQEKRSCPRWQVNWQARVKCGGRDSPVECYINNVNFKGLRLSFKEELQVNTIVSLDIFLTDDFALNIEAKIVWHKTAEGLHCHGLFFTRIKDCDKQRLSQFVRKNFKGEVNRLCWQDVKETKEETKGGEEEMTDRRIFERFSANFPVRFLDLNENKEGDGRLYNVSAKGLGLVTKENLKFRTVLEMWLVIPDNGEPLYTRGEVVWSLPSGLNEYRAGVNLDKADLMGLARVLRTKIS